LKALKRCAKAVCIWPTGVGFNGTLTYPGTARQQHGYNSIHKLETDRLRYTDDTSTDIPVESTALISAKDETIRVLREQLEAERAASAELRRIVAGLVQRVPELEPAREPTSEPRESPVTSSQEQGNSSVPPEQEKRSWLHRFFFGP
jgi:hypothetical protein